MKKLIIILSLFILVGCNGEKEQNQEKFEWAANFCGDKDKIRSFNFGYNFAYVSCKDNRYSDIP